MGGAKATSSGSVGWRVADLLATKMEGGHFTEEQVACIIQMVTDGSMDDCQLGALLVAVKVFGMNPEEVVALTRYMRDSGRVFEWPQEWKTVDKHSTGGVGDKVSLPLVPSLAALGLHVPMISGRGLEHTGGTLDKLESIPGYRVALSEEEMRAALSEAGGCIVGQTSNITPADKRMYAARDITATVNSLPLIVSSIISKKAAGGMKALVLDVKYGDSAFMKTVEEARTLAKAMVDVSGGLGIKTTALVTEMSNPIGKAIGNALEVMEALECLRGQGPADLKELVVHLGGELVAAGGLASSAEEGQRAVERVLSDGSALASFRKMLVMQVFYRLRHLYHAVGAVVVEYCLFLPLRVHMALLMINLCRTPLYAGR
ncbi:thymidine phosphorylase-like isoform X2 [Portunus trituberculatus]|uniref:thymidine phosphorylase-like isoform X2 n=1 Tax=Portunus trituberculatus TaxID=210409 RepID=UPI001E1CB172|nr:thymidine phosphorylase-like isoform X2 [Portunus trituberculatus]